MSWASRNDYDRGVNCFSPEGRIFQVEYAIEAIKLGTTAVGLCTKEGVVLAVEKRISSPLLVPKSVEKVMEVDTHIGCPCLASPRTRRSSCRRRGQKPRTTASPTTSRSR